MPAYVAALRTQISKVKPVAVLISSSALGKEIAGRTAVATHSGLITDAYCLFQSHPFGRHHYTPTKLARIADSQPFKEGERPDLTDARVVVAGGRGMNRDFGPAERLADLLKGALGTSRAATGAGWCPHSNQIGQRGKTVNSDPDAPIFEIADLSIVGLSVGACRIHICDVLKVFKTSQISYICATFPFFALCISKKLPHCKKLRKFSRASFP